MHNSYFILNQVNADVFLINRKTRKANGRGYWSSQPKKMKIFFKKLWTKGRKKHLRKY